MTNCAEGYVFRSETAEKRLRLRIVYGIIQQNLPKEENDLKRQNDSLLQGLIWKGLITFAMPILLGQVFQQLYNTADAWIVGHYLSDSEYAAVTSTGSLIFLLVGFFGGIAVGAGVIISRHFGAKDTERLQIAVHTTVAFGLAAGLLLTGIGVGLTPLMLKLMQTPDNVFPYSAEYFRFYFLGSLAIVMYNLGMGILRAVGDSKHPLYYLIFSSLVNIALDLLFVGGFGWGVWSAALATTISQFISVFLCLYRLAHYKTDYQLHPRRIRFHLPMLREIIKYGLPSGVQNSIIAFANVIVQTNINSFGENTVAGCGTYAKLEGFAFLPITCFTMALTTFVSQNLGARQYDRVKKGTKLGTVGSVLAAELIGVALIVFARPLMGFFTDNEAAIGIGIKQSRVESLFFCMLSFSHCIAAIMRGAGKPMVPMFVMLATWCAIRVAYISIMVPIEKESWVIFSAYPLTWTISSVIFLIYYLKSDWLHAFDRAEAKKTP
ncbi:MAG: MATE family efflux transporter [Oscillospiraceae bacterium]|nr:MATE family efflux transporter [Oscillospiraceae bacterium]